MSSHCFAAAQQVWKKLLSCFIWFEWGGKRNEHRKETLQNSRARFELEYHSIWIHNSNAQCEGFCLWTPASVLTLCLCTKYYSETYTKGEAIVALLRSLVVFDILNTSIYYGNISHKLLPAAPPAWILVSG